MTLFDPRAEVANFLRSMAQAGVEATVVWSKNGKGAATSNQGAEGIARATSALSIKGDALTRAAKALHVHMVALPGAPAPDWAELDAGEQETIRTLCKVVLAAAMTPEAPNKLVSV
jgi:hypothetical protein